MKILKYAIAALLLVGQVSCIDKKFEDQFTITVTPDAVVGKAEVSVVNAKPDEDGEYAPVENATISFSSSDASKIFTIGGTKANANNGFALEGGTVVLGILTTADATPDNPIEVTGTIKADGYLDRVVELSFDGETVTDVQFALDEKDNLVDGVTFDEMSIDASKLDASGETTEEIVSTISTTTTDLDGNTVEEEVEMTIPAGTGFLDENGNQVATNDVALQVQTFSPAAAEGDGFPGGLGFESQDAVVDEPSDPNAPPALSSRVSRAPRAQGVTQSTKSNNFIFSRGRIIVPVTNLYCMYGYARRTVYLRNCTRYTIVRNYFYKRGRNVINPVTGQQVQVGDKIDVYHKWSRYSRNTDYLTRATVRYDAGRGKYYAEFATRRFGIFPMGYTLNNTGCNPTSFSGLTLTNNSSPGYYRFIISHQSQPNRYLGYGWFYLGNSRTVTAWDLRRNYYFQRLKNLSLPGMKLRIDAYSYTNRRYVTLYNEVTSICDLNGATIPLNHPDCTQNVNLNLNIACPDVNVSMNYSSIQYRPEGSRWYRRYGYIYRGYVRANAPCLDDNTNYQFRVWYNGYKETPFIKGSDIKNAIELPTDDVCDKISDI